MKIVIHVQTFICMEFQKLDCIVCYYDLQWILDYVCNLYEYSIFLWFQYCIMIIFSYLLKRALIRNIITIKWFLVGTQINESKQRSCLLSYALSPHCGTKFVYKYLTNISKIIFFLLGFNHWIFKDGKRNPKDHLLRMPYSYCKYLIK